MKGWHTTVKDSQIISEDVNVAEQFTKQEPDIQKFAMIVTNDKEEMSNERRI